MDFRPEGNRFDDPVHNDPLHRDPLHADPLNVHGHADPLHTHAHTHDTTVRHEWYHKSPPKWLLVPLLLLLVGAGAAAANHHDNWQGADRGYNNDGQIAHASVAYQGRVWLPQGAPVLLPDRRMVRVGETVEGLDLYQVSVPTGGGGGPVAQPLVPANQVFLRVGADQYQALNLVHIGNQGIVGPRLVGPR